MAKKVKAGKVGGAPAQTAEEKIAAKEAAAAVKQAADLAKEAGKPGAKDTAVDVLFKGGVRTYSKELHGAKFRAYADEFAGKAEGRHVVAHAED